MSRSRLNANQVPAIDGTAIGGVTPADGSFANLNASGTTALTGPLSSGGSVGVAGQILRSIGAGGAATWTAGLVSGTAQNSTSGANIDFNSVIPSWAKRITVMFNGVSTSGTSGVQIQIGASGGIESTGYAGLTLAAASASSGVTSFTSGFVLSTGADAATSVRSGAVTISNLNGNTWVAAGGIADTVGVRSASVSYAKTLAGVLDRVRITTIGGSDTFDAGSINIMWE